LTRKEQDAIWDDLAAEGGNRVQRAIWALIGGGPKQAGALIQDRLKLPQPVEPQRLLRLIADLDADRFAVREKAAEELEKLTDLAAPALEKALQGNPSPETRQRIESILGKLAVDTTPAPEVLRGLRAVEVLEWIGGPEARDQLERIARTEPPSRVSKAALSALKRLGGRTAEP
jgi:hypothetical protein